MSLSSALGRLRSTSRARDHKPFSARPPEPQRGTVSSFLNRSNDPRKKPKIETTGYQSLLSEDAIPNLQRTLASIANTILTISEGDGLRNALKVMELEGTILGLLQHIRVLRNHAQPICRLPPELLSMVFELVAASKEDESAPTLKDIVSLTHVCRYWRAVLLNHNGVWSNIHLNGQDPSLITKQIERCGGAALNLNLHLQYWMFRRENTRLLNNFRGALMEIRLHRNQVRRLVVHIACCQAFHQYFDFDLPNLEELVWEDLCVQHAATHNSTPPDPGRNWLPSLRHLSVKRTLHWPMEFTSGLTTFKLEGHIMVPSDKLADFLQRNPRLESLELTNLHVPYQWLPQQPIELHHLTCLSIRNAEHGHIFPHITLPSLMSLEIGPFDQPPRWVASVWSCLQVPPGIDTLTVTYHGCGGDRNKISVVGSDKTSKRLLALEEHSVGRRLTPVFNALANASLGLVTTLHFDEEGLNFMEQAPVPPVLALLKSLPRLERVNLGWGYLAREVIACLNDRRELCPELEDLRVTVTRVSYLSVFESVKKLILSRADGERRFRRIECMVSGAEEEPETIKRLWNKLFRTSGLERSLRDAGNNN